MISKMFILLIALLIILGLHCAYSAPLTNIHNKSYDIENIENFETSRQESNISTSNINTNTVGEGYDPEVNKLLGYCYYDNTPSCNKTDLPIHGCATTKQQDDVYEFFPLDSASATAGQQQAGSSAIYGRALPPAVGVVASSGTTTTSINSCPTAAGATVSRAAAAASTAAASTAAASTAAAKKETCIPSQYEQCRDCDITTNKNINKYVLKNSIPPDKDMSLYAKKANLCPCTDMSKYMLKSAIPACDNQNLSNYIKKSEIPACPVCPTCPKPTAGHIHDHPDYRKYISRRDCEKQCTSHINKKPDVDINDPSFKKAVDKYIKNNNYIKKSDDNGIGNGLSYENKGVNLAMNKGTNANANTNTNHNMNQNTNHNQNINTSTNANTGSNYDTYRKQNINSPNAPYASTNAPYAPTNAPYAPTNAPYSPTNVPQKYRTNKTSTVGYSTTGEYNDLYQRC